MRFPASQRKICRGFIGSASAFCIRATTRRMRFSRVCSVHGKDGRRETARPEQIRAWLTRIVINECHNIQRKRMRVVLMGEMPEMAAPEDTYEAEAELRSAIDSLPEKLRVPLLLRYMERYSETEIAQTLGVPVTTVKNRLFRARRAVRAKFDEEVTFE